MIFLFPRWDMLASWRVYGITYFALCCQLAFPQERNCFTQYSRFVGQMFMVFFSSRRWIRNVFITSPKQVYSMWTPLRVLANTNIRFKGPGFMVSGFISIYTSGSISNTFYFHAVDCSEIPNNHLGCIPNPVNNCIIYHINWWLSDFWTINNPIPSMYGIFT